MEDIRTIRKPANIQIAHGMKYVQVGAVWFKVSDENEREFHYHFQRV